MLRYLVVIVPLFLHLFLFSAPLDAKTPPTGSKGPGMDGPATLDYGMHTGHRRVLSGRAGPLTDSTDSRGRSAAQSQQILTACTAADSKNSAGFFTDHLLIVGALIGARAEHRR